MLKCLDGLFHLRLSFLCIGVERSCQSLAEAGDMGATFMRIDVVEAFNHNEDVHRLTASLIYNISESEVKEQMREVAKRVNFGIIYGQSAYGLSKDLEISINQAQDFIDAYFLRYPKVKEYIDAQIKKAQTEGFVRTLLGRRRYLPEINNKNMGIRQFAQRQAVNTPIQGSASDLIKLAMIKIDAQIKKAQSEGFVTTLLGK